MTHFDPDWNRHPNATLPSIAGRKACWNHKARCINLPTIAEHWHNRPAPEPVDTCIACHPRLVELDQCRGAGNGADPCPNRAVSRGVCCDHGAPRGLPAVVLVPKAKPAPKVQPPERLDNGDRADALLAAIKTDPGRSCAHYASVVPTKDSHCYTLLTRLVREGFVRKSGRKREFTWWPTEIGHAEQARIVEERNERRAAK